MTLFLNWDHARQVVDFIEEYQNWEMVYSTKNCSYSRECWSVVGRWTVQKRGQKSRKAWKHYSAWSSRIHYAWLPRDPITFAQSTNYFPQPSLSRWLFSPETWGLDHLALPDETTRPEWLSRRIRWNIANAKFMKLFENSVLCEQWRLINICLAANVID